MHPEIRIVRLEDPLREKESATHPASAAPVTTGRSAPITTRRLGQDQPALSRTAPGHIRESDDAVHARIRLIERVARGECSVVEACREASISRARFYQLRDAYLRHGPDGLRPKPRPARPDRRLPPSVEEAVVAYALLHPAHGERTIARALSRPELGGLRVSPHGVGGVLRRAGLSRAQARQAVGEPRPAGLPDRAESESHRDDETFSRLYLRYRRYVLSVCLRRLGDQARAEDATQETFARVYANLSRFDARHKARPWIRTIAVNVCTNMYHRGARVEAQDPTDEAWLDRWILDGPLELVVAKERYARLGQALAALPSRQRRALLLHALEGWNYGDIASAEGTSVQAVKSLLFRARETLRHAREVGALGLLLFPWRTIRGQLGTRYPRTRLAVSRALGGEVVSPGTQMIASFVATLAMLVSGGMFSHERPDLPRHGTYRAVSSLDVSGPADAIASGRNAARSAGARSVQHPARDAQSSDRFDVGSLAESARDDLVDPTGDATPENSGFTSIDPSPAFDRDRTVFAAGGHACSGGRRSCPVLFVTHDGGARWHRLPAEGLVDWVEDLALLPTYPEDPRIFAIDVVGLKESTDHGASFHLVGTLPVGTRTSAKELAISPRFGADDSRILVGSKIPQSVMEYRDDTKQMAPRTMPIPLPRNFSLEPVFSPGYATDHLTLFIGVRPVTVGEIVRQEFVVHRCDRRTCDTTALDGVDYLPSIRLSPAFHTDGLGFAFAYKTLLRTRDGARTFTNLDFPPGTDSAADIEIRRASDRTSVAIASFWGYSSLGRLTRGLYKSVDEGDTWTPIAVDLPGSHDASGFDRGFGHVQFAGSRGTIFATGIGGGIICSSDDGKTWATRC